MQRDITKAVCKCRRVYFEDIENAVKDGATSFEEVQKATGVSQGCGVCLKRAKEITDFALSKK